MMMQAGDSHNQKKSLFHAMNRFMRAVTNMDQTVMVPSVLRGVPLEHGDNGEARPLRTATTTPPREAGGGSNGDIGGGGGCGGGGGGAYFPDGDMYSSYILLKSIRNDMEWGLVRDCCQDISKAAPPSTTASEVGGGGEWDEEEGEEDEEDLQKQFHFHLSGLHAVLNKLTRKADSLASRYKQEIGVRGCGN